MLASTPSPTVGRVFCCSPCTTFAKRTINLAFDLSFSLEYNSRGNNRLSPITERDSFKAFLSHGFQQAGCTTTLLSDSAIEIICLGSKGNPRQAHQIVIHALRLEAEKNQNHLPDDVVKEAVVALKLN